MRRMAHQALQRAQARLEQLQRQCDEAFMAYEANPHNEPQERALRRAELITTQGRRCCAEPGYSSWCCKYLRLAAYCALYFPACMHFCYLQL